MSQPQNKKRKHQAYVVEVKDPYDTPSHDPVIKIEDDDEEKPDLWKCDDEHSKSWTKTTPEEAGTQDGRSFTSQGVVRVLAGTGDREITVCVHTHHLKKFSDYFAWAVAQHPHGAMTEHRLADDIRGDIMVIFAEFVYSPDLKEILQRAEYNERLSYWQFQCLTMDIYLWAQKVGSKRFAAAAVKMASFKETGKPLEELVKYRDVLRELRVGECKLRERIMAHLGASWPRYQRALDTDTKGRRFVEDSPELIAALLRRNTGTKTSERDAWAKEMDEAPRGSFRARSPRKY